MEEELLQNSLNDFDKKIEALLQCGRTNQKAITKRFFFKMFVNGMINRAVNVGRGFNSLIRDNNFIAAAPLVRIQLDSLLRFYAASNYPKDCEEFAEEVYNGAHIRKMTDEDGEKMFDGNLARKLSKEQSFEWVQRVYNDGSGYVHLSDQSIFSSTNIIEKTKQVQLITGPSDSFVKIEEKYAATILMITITEGIRQLVEAYLEAEKQSG